MIHKSTLPQDIYRQNFQNNFESRSDQILNIDQISKIKKKISNNIYGPGEEDAKIKCFYSVWLRKHIVGI